MYTATKTSDVLFVTLAIYAQFGISEAQREGEKYPWEDRSNDDSNRKRSLKDRYGDGFKKT
jgi:hypothetical protein